MEVINISPEFLISEQVNNPIVKRNKIIAIELNNFMTYRDLLLNTIIFHLEYKRSAVWTYTTEESCLKEFDKIKTVLNKISITYESS